MNCVLYVLSAGRGQAVLTSLLVEYSTVRTERTTDYSTEMDVQEIALTIATAYVAPPLGTPCAIGDATTVALLLSELRAGVHIEPACSVAGVSYDSVRRWMKRGDAGEVPYDAFNRAVNAARGSVESEVVRNILTASKLPAYWAAGMTYLERTAPTRWARPSDRQDRQTAAIEVHVHGIGRQDVLIGVTQRDTQPSNTAQFPNDLPGAPLIENQVPTTSGQQLGAISTYAPLIESVASSQLQTPASGQRPGSGGAAPPRGAPAAAIATPAYAAATIQRASATVQSVQEPEKPLLIEAASTSTRAQKPKRVKDPTLPPHLQRYANPAAIRRMKLLHREAQIKRKKRKTARAYADSLRHQANREAAKAEKQRLLALKAEASLPDVIVVPE